MSTKKIRPIDKMAKESFSWISRTFVFINKTQVKTWQGIFIIAFIAGITTALMWSISFGWHPFSEAASSVPKDQCIVTPAGGEYENPVDVEIKCGNKVKEAHYQWGSIEAQTISGRKKNILFANTQYLVESDQTLRVFGATQGNKNNFESDFDKVYEFKKSLKSKYGENCNELNGCVNNLVCKTSGDVSEESFCCNSDECAISTGDQSNNYIHCVVEGGYVMKNLNDPLICHNGEYYSPEFSTCNNYEVCDGYIVSNKDISNGCLGICKLPKSFDWTDKHGENWITPNKNQSPAKIGACSEFAFVDAFESQINLYYNQHLDLDLSEQMKVDCNHGTSPLKISSNDMLVDEKCSPFVNRDIYCNGEYQSTQEDKCCDTPYLCDDWQDRTWKSLGYDICHIFPYTTGRNCLSFEEINSEEKVKQADDEIKMLLISKGPIKAHITGMGHSMLLVGYENSSDWKTKEICNAGTEMCVSEKGCIPSACNRGDDDLIDSFYYYAGKDTIDIYYSCREYGDTGVYQWSMIDYKYKYIGRGTPETPEYSCDPLRYGFYPVANGGYKGQFNAYLQYIPGNGDTIWIFRNSIGGDIEKWSMDPRQFGKLIIPSGPFTSPTNKYYWPSEFDDQIKCVDKDNDGFCNWGISEEKPSICPSICNVDKDWDDLNPNIGALATY